MLTAGLNQAAKTHGENPPSVALAGFVIVAGVGIGGQLGELDEAGLRFMLGSRTTKAPIDLRSHFRRQGNVFTGGQAIGTTTPRSGHRSQNDQALRAEPARGPAEHTGLWRAEWVHSAKRGARDGKTLSAQQNPAAR